MHTIDDVSTGIAPEAKVPGIVVVASERTALAHVLAVPASLGRAISAGGVSLEIADERMSREHASVRRERDAWVITDRGSRNGSWIDGEQTTGEIRRRGDVVVRLGHTLFVLLEDVRGHDAPATGEHVVGPELARAFADIERGATAEALLVHGESGSGKELAARRFHDAGPRRAGPFVAVNCAAIPEGVAERLLFGAKKGAYSGATDAPGHFQEADGGTLFLDEIADLDLTVQAKLLRVLESRQVQAVGARAPTPLDVGIVAASHRELRRAVADGNFRDDLYYRLARVTVRLPPLRERKVDLARLVQREVADVDRALAPAAKLLETCMLRPWPGNVRELRASIREAAVKARAAGRDSVRVEDLAEHAGRALDASPHERGAPQTGRSQPQRTPAELDRAAVEAALASANGVVAVAARALGLHRTQLYRLMDKLGIARTE